MYMRVYIYIYVHTHVCQHKLTYQQQITPIHKSYASNNTNIHIHKTTTTATDNTQHIATQTVIQNRPACPTTATSTAGATSRRAPDASASPRRAVRGAPLSISIVRRSSSVATSRTL